MCRNHSFVAIRTKIVKMLLGWLSDGSNDDKVRDDHRSHRRAHTEPAALGKLHNPSNSRVSINTIG